MGGSAIDNNQLICLRRQRRGCHDIAGQAAHLRIGERVGLRVHSLARHPGSLADHDLRTRKEQGGWRESVS